MTVEKAKEILQELWRYKDTDKYTEAEIREALSLAINVLSTEGEYIKKADLLQMVVTEEFSDFSDDDVVYADRIDDLPTYSIPDSADIEKIRAEIEQKINENISMVDGTPNEYAYCYSDALDIIDKHIKGE